VRSTSALACRSVRAPWRVEARGLHLLDLASVFVDDADATLAKCQAAGAEVVEEIETKPWGTRRFTMRDPDANLIDISHRVHDPNE
jgi:predicted enzyme related to lactoylglutathione lyase